MFCILHRRAVNGQQQSTNLHAALCPSTRCSRLSCLCYALLHLALQRWRTTSCTPHGYTTALRASTRLMPTPGLACTPHGYRLACCATLKHWVCQPWPPPRSPAQSPFCPQTQPSNLQGAKQCSPKTAKFGCMMCHASTRCSECEATQPTRDCLVFHA